VFRFMIRVVQVTFFQGAGGFEELFAAGFLREPLDALHMAEHVTWWWRLLLPALGGLLVGPLVWRFAREARGHGVPEVMAAVALRGGVIRPRVVAVKALASAISIGSGGSVGREGPIVQIGSALGSTLGQLMRVPASQLRVIVGCGAAAGISATFNAPIAGALFAAEIVVGNFAVAQLSPVVISSVVAAVVSRMILGDHPAFPVPPYGLVSPFELVPYLVLGLLAGLVALAFSFSLYRTEGLFAKIPVPEWVKPCLGGLLVGAIGIWLPNVFGVGYATIELALANSLPAALLGALLVAKIAATSITIGSGGSGGVFAPSLFLGAMAGGCFGSLVHQWFPDSTGNSGAYALVAMGAVVSAATHAPLSSIMIIFELTQTLRIIPPLMAACVVSSLVATFLSRDSIYTRKLRRQGIDLYQEQSPNLLKLLHVHDIIDRRPETLPASADLASVLQRVLESERTEFFVLDEAGRLVGAIHLRELTRTIAERELLRDVVVASDLMQTHVGALTEDDDLDVALQMFGRDAAEELPIVAADDPRRLVGSIHKRDLIQAYNQEVLRRDLAGHVSSTVLVAARGQSVDLGAGYVLQEIQPPPSFFGRSIGELDVARTFRVQIVLLRERAPATGQPAIRVPTAADVIREGDRLVVAGPRAAVEALDVL
jgi:CIC family chloride channel protein